MSFQFHWDGLRLGFGEASPNGQSDTPPQTLETLKPKKKKKKKVRYTYAPKLETPIKPPNPVEIRKIRIKSNASSQAVSTAGCQSDTITSNPPCA